MSWRDYDDYYPRYPKTKPKAVEGGIKAEARRGGAGRNWWAKRWIAVLESFDIGARIGRGRSYARQGQVLDVDVDREIVTAQVQGSRDRPYKIIIRVKAITPEQWSALAENLSSQAIFAAKLLAGEMPTDIETAFEQVGLSLFPTQHDDLETRCSCPDWSNPCKHIAAVYYVLGEEFDRDPFLIFRLRGMERESLVALLSASVSGDPGGEAASSRPEAASAQEPEEASEPLPTDPPTFWHHGQLGDDLLGEIVIPDTPAALPRRLGRFPFWRGKDPLLSSLEPIYRAASQRGMAAVLPEQDQTES
jgi:uncharacterized Zn finger protein